ncbi:WXG100 family type VII secretion target [Saccharopolyspora hirsuta]|uniref:ESAT-6-like protein n=1 Tax=Saccharopolyspora hirsuta TaxID=1837 RepID=A0A5M7BLK9_SACHI|nr:WXG100 family type VII secretion target [Saccharopolyspora hirsuta]KAA5830113.1 WXG100 family type VII secretion target [Saccharopolyspora hirsuta]MBF6507436.1 WXG100 family type VII secretion target [Nocardia farcinica]
MANQMVQTATPGMQQAAQHFSQTASDFTTQLRRVNTTMAALQASWHGEASQRFNVAMDNWELSFNKIIEKLLHMMEEMGVNTKAYVAAEDEATNVAQSFVSALPPLPGV